MSDLRHSAEQAAIAHERRAVDRLRRLADVDPNTSLPDLAAALHRLGSRVRWTDPYEAVDLYKEATDILRGLADAETEKNLLSLSRSLAALGDAMLWIARCSDAVEALNEAAEICRRLAGDRPDQYIDELDSRIHTLHIALRAGRRFDEAVGVAREAVARQRQSGSQPGLAHSLRRLCSALCAAGDFEQALEAARESVAILQAIAEDNSSLDDVGGSLHELGYVLALMGRLETFQAIGELVAVRLKLLERAKLKEQLTSLAAESFFIAEFPAHLVIRNVIRLAQRVADSSAWVVFPQGTRERIQPLLEWRPRDSWWGMCEARPPGWDPRRPVRGPSLRFWRWLGVLEI
jgi:tetratricopeptide (TPR) repeat protein